MKDWFEKLVKDYPLPFANSRCKYMACGPGWEVLLRRLIVAIHMHLQAKPKIAKNFAINDIKEKFGSLRFYYDGGDAHIEKLVEEAEFWSARTCDVCGQPGILAGQHWLQTVCPEHKKTQDPWSRELSNWIKA